MLSKDTAVDVINNRQPDQAPSQGKDEENPDKVPDKNKQKQNEINIVSRKEAYMK